jgi:hypothetical protein
MSNPILPFVVTNSVIIQNFINLEKKDEYIELKYPSISAIAEQILLLKEQNDPRIDYYHKVIGTSYLHIKITFKNKDKDTKNLYFVLNEDNNRVLGGYNLFSDNIENKKLLSITKKIGEITSISNDIDFIIDEISSVKIAIIRHDNLQEYPFEGTYSNKLGGGKSYSNIKYKEILGKKMRIYKIANSRKEHVKYKGDIITLSEYRKLMEKKSNSKKALKAKKISRSK